MQHKGICVFIQIHTHTNTHTKELRGINNELPQWLPGNKDGNGIYDDVERNFIHCLYYVKTSHKYIVYLG